jgi:hypothetical protein
MLCYLYSGPLLFVLKLTALWPPRPLFGLTHQDTHLSTSWCHPIGTFILTSPLFLQSLLRISVPTKILKVSFILWRLICFGGVDAVTKSHHLDLTTGP